MKRTLNQTNIYHFRNGGTLVCTSCGREVTKGDSYSNMGSNLVCIDCVNSKAKELNMDIVDYLKKYVWNRR